MRRYGKGAGKRRYNSARSMLRSRMRYQNVPAYVDGAQNRGTVSILHSQWHRFDRGSGRTA